MRWRTRYLGGHRDPEVEQVAAIDLRDGLLEARADRIAELEREVARLRLELARALLPQWMPVLLRQRAAAANEPTVEVPRRDLHAPTEYMPRRHR